MVARALYERPPDTGPGSLFAPEDFADEAVEVWPDNWPIVQFFSRLGTQWRVGFGGPTGLDYTAVLALMRTLRLKRDDFEDFFAGVQTMERAALDQMAADAKTKK